MPLELWILLGLIAAGLVVGIAARRLRPGKRAAAKEARNVYPLW